MADYKEQSFLEKIKKLICGEAYFVFLCFLFSFSIVSLICEILFSQSVTALGLSLMAKWRFIQKNFPWLLGFFQKSIPEILRAGVVLEIVKILGFGNVLIAVVQVLMEKKTFGVSYANIIKKDYRHYQAIFAFHLLATIMCIWFSAASASEGALVTLLLMLLGFLYLWLIIDDLVFHTANREDMAIKILHGRFSDPDNTEILNAVQSIAREATKEENLEKHNILTCFSEAMLRYCKSKTDDPSTCDLGNTIREISSIWDTALVQKSESEQLRYAARVIAECCKAKHAEASSIAVLSSGLIHHLFTQLNSSFGTEQISTFEDFFIKLSNLIYLVNNTLSEYLDNKSGNASAANNNIDMAQQYMRTLYTVLVWTKVQEGILRITNDVLVLDVYLASGDFNSVLLETVCATMSLTTEEEHEEKKALVNTVFDKLGLLPKGDAVNAS